MSAKGRGVRLAAHVDDRRRTHAAPFNAWHRQIQSTSIACSRSHRVVPAGAHPAAQGRRMSTRADISSAKAARWWTWLWGWAQHLPRFKKGLGNLSRYCFPLDCCLRTKVKPHPDPNLNSARTPFDARYFSHGSLGPLRGPAL